MLELEVGMMFRVLHRLFVVVTAEQSGHDAKSKMRSRVCRSMCAAFADVLAMTVDHWKREFFMALVH